MSNSMATPMTRLSFRRMATTRARYVSLEIRLVSSSWLPTLGKVFMSSRPPWLLTSRACAFSTMLRPLASCHLACTGTMTGKRLLRRRSFVRGGAVSRSPMDNPHQRGYAAVFAYDFQFGWRVLDVLLDDIHQNAHARMFLVE